MYNFNSSFDFKQYKLFYSKEILDYSYPNKNYESIAKFTFETILSNLKNKQKNLYYKIYNQSDEVIFINAHGKNIENNWVFFEDSSNKYTKVEEYISNLRKDYSYNIPIITYICNPNGIKINSKNTIYPLSNVHSMNLGNDIWKINK